MLETWPSPPSKKLTTKAATRKAAKSTAPRATLFTGKGYGDAFIHRTGHSLGTQHTHGEAVHLDDFETRDTRELRPGVAVTVEPGVYLKDFGVRSEINLVLEEGGPQVTTEEQRELVVVPVLGS